MKLVTNKKIVSDLLAEVLLEYSILEANPFAAAEKDEGGGEEAGGDAEAEGGEEKEKADAKPKEGGDELSIKFDQSAVKKYNTNTDWKASEAPVKKITKKGIEVDIAGNNVLINFDDITESANNFFSKSLKEAEEKLDAEDKKQIKDLEAEMGAVAKELGSAFDSAQDKIEQEVEKMPEKELNEALGATAIIGFILALPKLVEIITKSVSKLVNLIKKYTKADPPKTEEEQAQWQLRL
jgi:hypothetical protein